MSQFIRIRIKHYAWAYKLRVWNCSYLDGYAKQRAYIATQAPLSDTTEDFWRMVVKERSRTIVMLTELYRVVLSSVLFLEYNCRTPHFAFEIDDAEFLFSDGSVRIKNFHLFLQKIVRYCKNCNQLRCAKIQGYQKLKMMRWLK